MRVKETIIFFFISGIFWVSLTITVNYLVKNLNSVNEEDKKLQSQETELTPKQKEFVKKFKNSFNDR